MCGDVIICWSGMTISSAVSLCGAGKYWMLQAADCLQHLFSMAGNLDLWPGGKTCAVSIQNKGCPLDAHIAFSIHRFFEPDTELLGDGGFIICAESQVRACFARNFACFAAVSFEMPITRHPAAANSSRRPEKAIASLVQPDVSARGKKNITVLPPASPADEKEPVSVGIVKWSVVWPVSSML